MEKLQITYTHTRDILYKRFMVKKLHVDKEMQKVQNAAKM